MKIMMVTSLEKNLLRMPSRVTSSKILLGKKNRKKSAMLIKKCFNMWPQILMIKLPLNNLYFLDFEAWKGLWTDKGSSVHICVLKQPINYYQNLYLMVQ